MNVGLYQGAASMQALERWQEAVSQNLASASVPGYKGTAVDFDTVMSTGPVATLNAPGPQGNSAMPVANLRRDLAQGELRATGQPENMAIQGSGYFQVRGADGKPAYTRDGEFHRNAEGDLVTKSGLAVLGQSGAPIHIDAKKGEITVGADGKITQGDAQVDSIGVFQFKEQEAKGLSGGLFRPGNKDKVSAVEQPKIASGFIEQSNVSTLRSMVELITVQRAYEANQKAISTHDQRLSSAIQILGNPAS